MSRLLIFGLGYTAKRIASAMEAHGWTVSATGSAGDIDFTDSQSVLAGVESASHILSSVPPDRKTGGDPVLDTYGAALAGRALFYLSCPGRSIRRARRIDLPGQVFSRVHVDDIASGVVAAMMENAPAGAYNLGDDLPASGNAITEHACALLGVEPPKMETLEEANLSEMARGFYAENRRVANGKAKRILGWRPKYPTYVEGLASLR